MSLYLKAPVEILFIHLNIHNILPTKKLKCQIQTVITARRRNSYVKKSMKFGKEEKKSFTLLLMKLFL